MYTLSSPIYTHICMNYLFPLHMHAYTIQTSRNTCTNYPIYLHKYTNTLSTPSRTHTWIHYLPLHTCIHFPPLHILHVYTIHPSTHNYKQSTQSLHTYMFTLSTPTHTYLHTIHSSTHMYILSTPPHIHVYTCTQTIPLYIHVLITQNIYMYTINPPVHTYM